MSRPLLAATLVLLLAACGGGGGDGPQSDPLVPEVSFGPPNPLVNQGTAQVELQVINKSSSNITNIRALITYPPGVAIEGGSVGSLCAEVTSGDATATGYEFTLSGLQAGAECGVFMDIYSTTGSGDMTFSVSPGGVTGDGVSPNKEAYSWVWDSP